MLVGSTYPHFEDSDGSPLNAGYIYFGTPNLNPETNPITVYWDAALTQPAAQPIRTLNGAISRDGAISNLYVGSNYSITIKNKNGILLATLPDSNLFDPAALANLSAIKSVDTIAALKLLLKTGVGYANVLGYYAHGDGGGGIYYYDSADATSVDNGGSIIVAADGGRWKLQNTRDINVKQFGAKGDGAANDLPFIQACINAFQNSEINFPQGNYVCNGPILLTDISGHNFQGNLTGHRATITFTNNGNSTDVDSAMQHGLQAYPLTNASGGDTTGMRGVIISGLNIVGPAHGASMYFANSQDVVVRECSTKTNRYGIANECCINSKFLSNRFNDYTNAGIGLIMSGDTARVWYGSGTPATSYWNDSPLIEGNGFATSALNQPLAHILDHGSQAESIRFIVSNYFFSNWSGSGPFFGTKFGYIGRNANPTFERCWFENMDYPIRLLSTNAGEGGGNLAGVAGAEPSGTYALSNFVDGFCYNAKIKGCWFSRGYVDVNVSGVVGSCEIGQNVSQLLQNGGNHILSNQAGNQRIIDSGDSVISPVGTYIYANLTAGNTRVNLAADWVSYTPTITSGGGALTSYVVNSARYLQRGKDILIHLDITITNAGTGNSNITVTLPANSVANGGTLAGRETVGTGKMIQGLLSGGNTALLFFYDNTYPGATNNRLVVSGVYETT